MRRNLTTMFIAAAINPITALRRAWRLSLACRIVVTVHAARRHGREPGSAEDEHGSPDDARQVGGAARKHLTDHVIDEMDDLLPYVRLLDGPRLLEALKNRGYHE